MLRAEEEARLLEEQKRTEVQRLVSNVVLMFLKVPTSPLEEPVKAELTVGIWSLFRIRSPASFPDRT